MQLKLAIDQALMPAASTPSLLSSYLQVLIMSEGDTFLHRTIADLSILMRDPASSPVKKAEAIVRSFCTKELRGVKDGVSDVEEYIANATVDLIIMSVWNLAATQLNLAQLPVSVFPWLKRGLMTCVRCILSPETFEPGRCFETPPSRISRSLGSWHHVREVC